MKKILPQFSKYQHEVWHLLAHGYSDREIARMMVTRSIASVQLAIKSIYNKLNLPDRGTHNPRVLAANIYHEIYTYGRKSSQFSAECV